MGQSYFLYCVNCMKSHSMEDFDYKKLNQNIKLPYFNVSEGATKINMLMKRINNEYIIDKNMLEIVKFKKDICEIIINKLNDGYKIKNDYISSFYCKCCKTLESHDYFILKKGNKKYIQKYRCKYCNKIMKKVNINVELINNNIEYFIGRNKLELICPICNGMLFESTPVEKWN